MTVQSGAHTAGPTIIAPPRPTGQFEGWGIRIG